jgi:parvulin-like peptidyl-prolyl isomerase
MTKHGKKNKVNMKTAGLSFLAILLAYVAVMAALLYGFGSKNALVQKTADMLNFPVAMVGMDKIVTADEMNRNVASVRKFYESQDFSEVGLRVDFSTPDGKKRIKVKERQVLNKLIENDIIEEMAEAKGISVTKKMAEESVEREIERYGSEKEVKENISKLYGWDMDDFIENIVKPDMYRDELEKSMRQTDGKFVQAEEKIKAAQEELKGGADFSEVVEKYSEGDSAANKGELGWFSVDQVMPEIAIFAFLMEKDELSDILETPLGFHIIRIDDKMNEDGQDKIKVSQILVRTKSFPDWLSDREKEMEVRIFSKDYYWDKDRSRVEFKDQELRDFESRLEENSPNDASVLF